MSRLSRRTILRGMGAAMAVPWLESAWAEDGTRLTEPPLRAAFLFMPNGVWPEHFTPKVEAKPGETIEQAKPRVDESWVTTPMLASLDPHKGEFSLLENLWNQKTAGRNGHWPKVPAFLSGGFVVRTGGSDIDTGGTSVDQVIAGHVGAETPMPSLELGVDEAYTGVDNVGGGFTRIYGSHIAWRDPHTPVPKEIVPQLAFDRLFRYAKAAPPVSGFTTKQKAVADSLRRDETSILDVVLEDARDLRRKVSDADRVKLDEYLESVRAVERRIESTMRPQRRWINEGRFEVPRPGPGIPESHEEHVRLMLDILVLALWTDSTRVATFMMGNAQTGRNFSFLDGVKSSFHGISHHRNEAAKVAEYERIGTWHLEQLAYLIGRMKGLDEGAGTLLDNSMVLWGTTLREGNSHDFHDLPIILAGGGKGTLNPGRRVRYARDTPLCNLYLSMLDRFGVKRDAFGDSTGRLEHL